MDEAGGLDHPSFDDFLDRLENLDKLPYLYPRAAVKCVILSLKVELRFLKTFSMCIARNDGLKDSSASSISAIKRALYGLFLECPSPGDINESTHTFSVVYKVLNVIEESRSKIRYFYDLFSVLADFYIPMSSSNLVLEFISNILQNLKDLVNPNFSLAVTLRSQVQELEKELTNLRSFLAFATKRCNKHEIFKGLLTQCEAVAIGAALLSYTCLADGMNEETSFQMECQLSNLLKKMKPIKPEARELYIEVLTALKLSESSDTSMEDVHLLGELVNSLQVYLLEILSSQSLKFLRSLRFLSFEGQLKMLRDELRFLGALLMDPPRQYVEPQNLNDLLRSIDVVTIESGSLIFSLYFNRMTEEIARQANLVLVNLLGKMKSIKAKAREIYLKVPKSSRSKFPGTDGLGFIQSFLENLEELLGNGDNSVSFLKHQIETIQKDFESLASFLRNMEKWFNQHEQFKTLRTRVIDVAYQTQYVIDSFVVKDCPLWYSVLQLSDITEEIQLVKADVTGIFEKLPDDVGVHNLVKHSDSELSSQASTPKISERVVGFEDEAEKLIQLLIRGSSAWLDIVSIVGMPGLGKTTLSKKVYNSLSVEKHFHVRAWCCVSQIYEKKNLLLAILGHVIELKDEKKRMNDVELAEVLYKSLKGRRYLVVMDDIWNIQAWHDLQMSLPDDNNGSRIMFTSRLFDVALRAKLRSNPHYLRPFTDNECWELLQELLFSKECCPLELEDIGKQIATSCKGVPLSVVLVAGLLKMDMTEDFWKQVSQNITSRIIRDPQTRTMEIIGMSYKHLPDHLKPCFLYFGAFPEDQNVPVNKLIRLWTAEGFVREVEGKSSEDTAESYLTDLISRSLVRISKYKANGGIKACYVHDLLSYFCKEKSREENFWQFDGYDDLFTSDVSDYSVNSDNSCPSAPTYEQHRLGIYSKANQFIMSGSSGSHVRSVVMFAASDGYPLYPSDISFISYSFKLLRVLDLGCLNIGHFPAGLELLVQLKYLALRVHDAKFIPPSIANLCKLETFIVEANRKVLIPETIWNMSKMRHLHIRAAAVFDSDYQRLLELRCVVPCEQFRTHFSSHDERETFYEGSIQLNRLETISHLYLFQGDEEEILRRIPNVRKLKCYFWDSFDSFSNYSHFLKLELLNKLESLNISYVNLKLQRSCEFNFPSRLKKLTLSHFRLPWTEISIIGRLENLEVLKLNALAFMGQRWDMIDGEFPKLKHLQLYFLNLQEWNGSSDHFPCLQRLQLLSCSQLKEVPSCFGSVETLEMIEVRWCSKLDLESVWQIQQEHEDMGNDQFKLLIGPQD